MEIRLLGPVEVRDGDGVVALPRRQQRALLAALALRAGEVVSTDRLIADLWGDRPPASAHGSLQNTVSSLRRALGRDVLVTQAPGYRLALPAAAVDANRFEALLEAARSGEPAERAALLARALELWRGPALADLEDEELARLAVVRLEELRVTAQEERVDAELELGRHAAVVGELETLVAAHPLRERLRGQLMLALYRCGRQAEALEVYRAARLALADELGLDPSPELQELERRVLRQDPSLATPAAVTAPPDEPAARQLVTVLAALPPADEDPERHRALLEETLAEVREALARTGGTLERFGPEGLVATFGAEGPRDDDAHRALATAEELGLPAGIATGEVVAGAGPVVTRAVDLARSDGISLDARTEAIVGATRRLDAPLAGRREELAHLIAALREDGCRVVTVVGEPGIGKTRLAREVALRAGEAATVLVARCSSYGEGASFGPLVEALRRADPEKALAGEPDAELVLTRIATLAGGEDARSLGESYWAVRRLLESLAPALLIVDDVHWAEPSLLDLVDYLGERLEADALVLCLTRPELDRSFGETLRLGPLDAEHARALVPADLDDATRERIVALAEGNALYVEQLSSYAAEGGEGLPPTLAAVLAGRLGRLGAEERAVLQRAAVVGRHFSRAALAALSAEPVDAALSSLSRRDLVHPAPPPEAGDDGYRFHHALLRDAAYATLTKADRADLHQRAAAWLDRDGPGDDTLVGYHLEQAAGYRRELGEEADDLAEAAGRRLGDAGMRLWRTNDPSSAAGVLARANALLPESALRAELLFEQSLTLRLQERNDEADVALERAERDARASGAEEISARAAVERALLGFFAGELALTDAVAAMDAAIDVLRAADDARGLGRAELHLSTLHASACNIADWAAAASRAELQYRAAGFSPAVCIGIQADALYYGAVPVDAALASCAELLDRSSDALANGWVSAVAGALHGLRGNHDEASNLIEHSRRLYENVDNQRGKAMAWTPLAMETALLAGDLDTAEALGRESVETFSEIGYPAFVSGRAAKLADVLLQRGDVDSADRYAALAEREALDADVYVQFLWRAARARILARGGELAEAEALGADAVAIASLTDALCDRARTHLALAEVLSLAGKQAAAATETAAAEELRRRKGVKGAPVGAPFA